VTAAATGLVLVLTAGSVGGCQLVGGSASGGTEAGETRAGGTRADRSTTAGSSLADDPARKLRAAQLTSTFENSTTELQYAYADDIGDGRGITAGRAGFTSGTSDLLLVVERYTARKPDNVLARYLPALEAVNGTDSVAGLDGFAAAWAEAAEDPLQRSVQDELVDELYFGPAMRLASDAGVETALGQAILWDTMIQHGAGGDNGTETIVEETTAELGPADGAEPAWLLAFLQIRLRHLGHMYADPEADASSRSRVDALRTLVSRGELALDPPLTWQVYGGTYSLA